MLQRVQKLINIKFAKAYSTISFEASCMMAGVPHRNCNRGESETVQKEHNAEGCEHECDIPLPVKEWPHPARRPNIMEIRDSTPYSTENIPTEANSGAKSEQGRQYMWNRGGSICGTSVEKAVQIQVTKLLFKQSSRTNRNLEVTGRTNIPFRP